MSEGGSSSQRMGPLSAEGSCSSSDRDSSSSSQGEGPLSAEGSCSSCSSSQGEGPLSAEGSGCSSSSGRPDGSAAHRPLRLCSLCSHSAAAHAGIGGVVEEEVCGWCSCGRAVHTCSPGCAVGHWGQGQSQDQQVRVSKVWWEVVGKVGGGGYQQ